LPKDLQGFDYQDVFKKARRNELLMDKNHSTRQGKSLLARDRRRTTKFNSNSILEMDKARKLMTFEQLFDMSRNMNRLHLTEEVEDALDSLHEGQGGKEYLEHQMPFASIRNKKFTTLRQVKGFRNQKAIGNRWKIPWQEREDKRAHHIFRIANRKQFCCYLGVVDILKDTLVELDMRLKATKPALKILNVPMKAFEFSVYNTDRPDYEEWRKRCESMNNYKVVLVAGKFTSDIANEHEHDACSVTITHTLGHFWT
jgi:hypothetical protein